MVSPEVPLIERVTTSFKQLSVAANNLNQASDDLGKAISVIDAAIKKLNLGVATWVQISGYVDENADYWSHDLGYAKVGAKWGIALRTTSGNHQWDESHTSENWLFNDAPRPLRIEGIQALPELIDELTKAAEDTTKTIKRKAPEAYQIALAIAETVKHMASDGRK